MPNSLLQCVGRGYSDLCGAMCAAGLAAAEYQIWKEVDGIFTADPSKVPSARVLTTVTAEEVSELTFFGSEVRCPTLKLAHNMSSNPRPSILTGDPSSNHATAIRVGDCLTIKKRTESLRVGDRYLSIRSRGRPPANEDSAGEVDRCGFYAFQRIPWAVSEQTMPNRYHQQRRPHSRQRYR